MALSSFAHIYISSFALARTPFCSGVVHISLPAIDCTQPCKFKLSRDQRAGVTFEKFAEVFTCFSLQTNPERSPAGTPLAGCVVSLLKCKFITVVTGGFISTDTKDNRVRNVHESSFSSSLFFSPWSSRGSGNCSFAHKRCSSQGYRCSEDPLYANSAWRTAVLKFQWFLSI